MVRSPIHNLKSKAMFEDDKKHRCRKGQCNAPLPEVYCERVMIHRREIPAFIQFIDALGDALLSYRILHPQEELGDRAYTPTWIVIWVNPRKHHSPEFLVSAGANIACGSFTLEEELQFAKDRDDSFYLQRCRELNCPQCRKNYLQYARRAMTHQQYVDSFAASAGIEV